jgi:hypothetical protein
VRAPGELHARSAERRLRAPVAHAPAQGRAALEREVGARLAALDELELVALGRQVARVLEPEVADAGGQIGEAVAPVGRAARAQRALALVAVQPEVGEHLDLGQGRAALALDDAPDERRGAREHDAHLLAGVEVDEPHRRAAARGGGEVVDLRGLEPEGEAPARIALPGDHRAIVELQTEADARRLPPERAQHGELGARERLAARSHDDPAQVSVDVDARERRLRRGRRGARRARAPSAPRGASDGGSSATGPRSPGTDARSPGHRKRAAPSSKATASTARQAVFFMASHGPRPPPCRRSGRAPGCAPSPHSARSRASNSEEGPCPILPGRAGIAPAGAGFSGASPRPAQRRARPCRGGPESSPVPARVLTDA